jgi:hypothetical protein
MAYKPLNYDEKEIRLLKIVPRRPGRLGYLSTGAQHDNRGDEIRCSIYHVALKDRPIYEALSYTWGDPTDTMPITLEGEQTMVTKNLYCTLEYIRHESDPRILWVDAVCIDQSNLVERSYQVLLMRDVYRQATSVIA